MQKFTVDEYILNHDDKMVHLNILREILQSTGMNETVKWGMPTYTIKGKNVVGLGAFKKFVSLWFFKGILLNDPENMLVNAQNDKNNSIRQLRFHHENEIDIDMTMTFVEQAIEIENTGKKLPKAPIKKLVLPPELKEALSENYELEIQFKNFSPSQQREFANYIQQAKMEETRLRRLDKIIPMILNNTGLSDKYRK